MVFTFLKVVKREEYVTAHKHPAESEVFTVWSLTGKVCQSLILTITGDMPSRSLESPVMTLAPQALEP